MHDTVSTLKKAENDQKSTLEKKASVIEEDNSHHSGNEASKDNNTTRTSKSKKTSNGGGGEAMEEDDDTQQERSKDQDDDDDEEMEDNGGNSSNVRRNSAQSTSTAGGGNGDTTNELRSSSSGESKKNNSQSAAGGNDTDPQQKKSNSQKNKNGSSSSTTAAAAPATDTANPSPVMRGTLFYEVKEKENGEPIRRHLIRGNWNYEGTKGDPQRFELYRTLADDEELEKLPTDGEFQGSFSLTYLVTTSKGKQKQRSKIISENGVKIKFTPIPDSDEQYTVAGKGNNQFGVFHIAGTAEPSKHDGDHVLNIEFRKSYEPPPLPAPEAASNNSQPAASAAGKNAKSAKTNGAAKPPEELPDPLPSYDTGVYCLRGKMYKKEDLGLAEEVFKVSGLWAAGLDVILADPDNSKKRMSQFEYEHKSMQPSNTFPVSGKYSGWFDWKNDDGSNTQITERGVILKFIKNNAGYYNVEGKGSNAFGKYTITGSLTDDNVITIFRHFAPRKVDTLAPVSSVASKSVTSAPPPINAPQAKRTSIATVSEPKLKMEDVVPPEPESGKTLEPIQPPPNTTYSAASQGTFRVNKDGSHSCQGKWAVARENFTNEGQTMPFMVRLEPHDATAAAEAAGKDPSSSPFPLDSAMYKGSFNMKKPGGRINKILDDQVVMKFRLNSQGSFNVYGKGINTIGVFELFGTLVVIGKSSGQIELYRTYPAELLNQTPAAPDAAASSAVEPTVPNDAISKPAVLPPQPQAGGIQRRESSRQIKLPPKLEEDDPEAQLARVMDKCLQVLRTMRDKDLQMGAFFSEPVDPVALGIPNYFQVIKEPMDLKTVNKKMDANEIDSPEEFARLVRLVFENAIKFNIDPAHSVHRAARTMLVLFNRKFGDIERQVQRIRKDHGDAGDKGKKGLDGKKKGKEKDPEKPKSLREQRLDEAQTMATDNTKAIADIVAAAPPSSATVSRTEFNLLLRLLETMQRQLVATHTLLANLSPGDEDGGALLGANLPVPAPVVSSPISSVVPVPMEVAPAPAPEAKKKPQKRKSEVLKEQPPPPSEDSTPLTIEEQTLLTETINELDQEHLGGVIQIIREAAPVGADQEEIDLEIDQLDHKTQRKLLRHVSKFIKKKSQPIKKKPKTANAQAGGRRSKTPPAAKPVQAPAPAPPPEPAPKAAAAKPPESNSFFQIFGNKDDSDSDSDEDGEVAPQPAQNTATPNNTTKSSSQGGKVFTLNKDDKDEDEEDDEEEEDGEEFDFGGTSWNIAKKDDEKSKDDGDDDDAWGAAREAAAAGKVREAERKAREKKIELEAENAKVQRLADAAARGEELRAQRAEEEAKEAELQKEKEKEAEEARKAARAAARAQVESVEQTVDLDAQRDIMKQYEQSYSGGDYGSASPSSDFGF